MLRDWLQLCRAQTAPATIALVLVAFLAAGGDLTWAVPLGAFAWIVHLFSFGHNSLMDTAMGYDLRDPSKKPHPLVAGRIKLSDAHKIIHWGSALLAVLGIAITYLMSPAPFLALTCFLLFVVFGNAYNSGLSKVSLLGFLPISICFAAIGAWGWLLASPSLGTLGWVLVAYFFFTILFQIGWSGFIKEMGVRERSNLLIKLGAKLRGGKFEPGPARYYGYGVKLINLSLGGVLLYLAFSWQGLVSLLFFGGIALYFLHQLTKYRKYIRDRELMNMSLEEVATIFLPLAIVAPLVPALALMAFGFAYFIGINKLLWAAPHPRV